MTNLNLSLNTIGDSGVASLSQALAANSSLTNLNLSKNEISASGAVFLSQGLTVNYSLTILDLSNNEISASGAASLSQALAASSSLPIVDLSDNEIRLLVRIFFPRTFQPTPLLLNWIRVMTRLDLLVLLFLPSLLKLSS